MAIFFIVAAIALAGLSAYYVTYAIASVIVLLFRDRASDDDS